MVVPIYVVTFYSCTGEINDEYEYPVLEHAISHLMHFLNDQSGLYRCIMLMKHENYEDKPIKLFSYAGTEQGTVSECSPLSIEALKRFVGYDIELITMKNEPSMITGLKGIINEIDDKGQIHVSWTDGSTLPVIVGIDQFMIG